MADTRALGFVVPEILIPAGDVNLKKWSVVACDQFTSEPEYWQEVEKQVGNSASALHIMLPEIYLNDENVEDNIAHMNKVMQEYIDDGVLVALPPGIMLVERHIGQKVRKGVMLAMDLEQYDFNIDAQPMIRPSEETVLARLPARIKIRNGAVIEMPHIILLIDDPQDAVIGNLHMQRGSLKKIYDFELMMDGGRVEGWLATERKRIREIAFSLAELPRRDNMLYCVGDGNHSLATAKKIWDDAKQYIPESEQLNHPLRYALCEIINLRDRAVEFMPIHRMISGVNPSNCAQFVVERLKGKGRDARLIFGRWNAATKSDTDEGAFVIPFLYQNGAGKIIIKNPQHPLAVGEVQDIFEDYVQQNSSASIDYIHGDDSFTQLSKRYDSIGFYFDAIKKEDFFDLVAECGVLPKKSFSIGEAEQKRYYMECRLLTYADYEESNERADN